MIEVQIHQVIVSLDRTIICLSILDQSLSSILQQCVDQNLEKKILRLEIKLEILCSQVSAPFTVLTLFIIVLL